MAKVDSARIAAIKANFEGGDTLTETNLADLIDALAEAAEDHQHVSSGGSGSGTGDAAFVINLQHGWDTGRPTEPSAGDIWIEENTSCVYVCFFDGIWVKVIG